MFLLRLHHKREAENKKLTFEELGYMLGVYWGLEDLDKPHAVPKIKVKQDKVMLPLSLAIAASGMNPKALSKIIDDMKKKAYSHNKYMESAEDNANALSKEEYLKMFKYRP